MPSNHLPLGPLKPIPQNRPPTAQETTSRWRTNLARGSDARAYESLESDYVTKLLAFMVQGILEEHKKANPEFGVRYFSILIETERLIVWSRNLTLRGQEQHS